MPDNPTIAHTLACPTHQGVYLDLPQFVFLLGPHGYALAKRLTELDESVGILDFDMPIREYLVALGLSQDSVLGIEGIEDITDGYSLEPHVGALISDLRSTMRRHLGNDCLGRVAHTFVDEYMNEHSSYLVVGLTHPADLDPFIIANPPRKLFFLYDSENPLPFEIPSGTTAIPAAKVSWNRISVVLEAIELNRR